MARLLILPLLASLAACTTHPPARTSNAPEATTDRLTRSAATPLHDLNLVRAKIPPALLEAKKAPYATPADATCAGLAVEVQALDTALGTDLDSPASKDDPGLLERGTELVSDSAFGAVQGAAEGVLPFRGWVRKLTGAERHAREVSASIAAGAVRRAYLKGLAQAAGCPAPPAPRQAQPAVTGDGDTASAPAH